MQKKSVEHNVLKTCVACGKKFKIIAFYASQQTCSDTCMHSFRRNGNAAAVEKTCPGCGVTFVTSYKLRNQKFCDRSCASKQSWNLGMTISTNEKLRATVAKASKTRADKMTRGEITINTRSKGSYFESKKSNKTVRCRSSYELKYAEMLESDTNVASFKVEPFFIQYEFNGSTKHYHPDFLVTFSDNSKQLVEVKPEKLINTQINVAKFAAARQWCATSNMVFVVVTERQLKLVK
jgi:hypothetical protein